MLTDDEQVELWRAVRAAVDVPLIAGTGTNDTRHTCQLTGGPRPPASTASSSSRRTTTGRRQAGLEAHFRAVAGATDLPVLLYDIPIRTGRKIATRCWCAWPTRCPTSSASRTRRPTRPRRPALDRRGPRRLRGLQRRRRLTLPLLAVGAVGVIGVAAHWAGAGDERDDRRLRQGRRRDQARQLNARLLESYDFETGGEPHNPMPAKAMLRALGLRSGQCRSPIGPGPRRPRGRRPRRAGRARALLVADPGPRSPSSAGSARSGATAPASRSTAASCSSTAGSCSPTPTCSASTSSCPTSPTCARTPTASRAASPPTATRTTSAGCRSCSASSSFPIYGSALTLGLARNRIEEAGLLDRTELHGRGRRRAAQDRPVRRASSSPSPTRCPTASPPRSTPRRA